MTKQSVFLIAAVSVFGVAQGARAQSQSNDPCQAQYAKDMNACEAAFFAVVQSVPAGSPAALSAGTAMTKCQDAALTAENGCEQRQKNAAPPLPNQGDEVDPLYPGA